ncbi:hypothetical protein FQK07_02495 [Synechococcus sp. BSF8S]|uniref:hypothetical protein n=1 Tax=Synechococcales TaxID=1890424 RepID=UPI00162687AE|nr:MULTISPECIES: hypothetical protein [unclassified Synechococcus]MBC1260148.1 hypothetical protein [Synechococcus sp. BSF8S]MBC1263035.1 hypothetical protein [Synechococcus sp. BSA11S]
MERSGSELPVVYENPWRALGRDLRAVAASCMLALRRLWRRQWEGDLPVPPFWPRRQATLFWPALLLALLLLTLGGGVAVQLLRSPSAENPGQASVESLPIAAEGTAAEVEATEPSLESPAVAGPDPREAEPQEPVAPSPGLEAIALPPGFSDDSGLVMAAPESGIAALLELRISQAFKALEEPERQRLAQQWWQQALGLGYERLRLIDSGGAELGRNAVVGGGMILLD